MQPASGRYLGTESMWSCVSVYVCMCMNKQVRIKKRLRVYSLWHGGNKDGLCAWEKWRVCVGAQVTASCNNKINNNILQGDLFGWKSVFMQRSIVLLDRNINKWASNTDIFCSCASEHHSCWLTCHTALYDHIASFSCYKKKIKTQTLSRLQWIQVLKKKMALLFLERITKVHHKFELAWRSCLFRHPGSFFRLLQCLQAHRRVKTQVHRWEVILRSRRIETEISNHKIKVYFDECVPIFTTSMVQIGKHSIRIL